MPNPQDQADAPAAETPQFTAISLAAIRHHTTYKKDFVAFVLDRFAAYTRSREVTDTRGRAVDPINDATARTSGGYGHWRLAAGWDNPPQHPQVGTAVEVTVEHWMSDDRGGGGQVTKQVLVPWDYIFGTQERDERYQAYLALRAEFDATGPEQVTQASPWPTNDHERSLFRDWQHEVANGDTNASFRDWVTAQNAD